MEQPALHTEGSNEGSALSSAPTWPPPAPNRSPPAVGAHGFLTGAPIIPPPTQLVRWPSRVREDGWEESGVGRLRSGRMLNFDIIALIILYLLPDVDDTPSFGWSQVSLSHVRWIAAAMCVSRAWYSCAVRTCELSGALLAYVGRPSLWRMVSARAMNAPRSLCYLDTLWWPDLDVYLDTAIAVFALPQSRWRSWTKYLEGRTLRSLEVLYLRPDDRSIPQDDLRSPTAPTYAPWLRQVTLCSPLVLVAPLLEYCSLSNFNPPQLEAAFDELQAVRHLEIHRTRRLEPVEWYRINWCQVFTHGKWDELQRLEIWCWRGESYTITSDAPTLSLPLLTVLNSSAPLLVSAPIATDVHLRHLYIRDVFRMLSGLPSVRHLSIASVMGDTWYDFNEGLPAAVLELDALRELVLTVGLTNGSLELLTHIRAQSLRELSFTCSASAAPNRAVLPAVAGVLDTALPGTVPGVREALQQARFMLSEAGYDGLAIALVTELAPVQLWNGDEVVVVANELALLRQTAAIVRDMVLATFDEGETPHAGYRVRDALMAGLNVMSLQLGTLTEVRLCIQARNATVLFEAEVYRAARGCTSRKICCDMTSPSFTSPAFPSEWVPLDSVAFGSARVLTGLCVLPVVELIVVNHEKGPFFSMLRSDRDTAALSESLSSYTAVRTLVVEIGGTYADPSLLDALVSADSLPALRHISIVTATRQQEWGKLHPRAFHEWWRSLERTLRRRHEAGNPLRSLTIDGFLCLERGYKGRLRQLVARLAVEVSCEDRVGTDCFHNPLIRF